MTEEDQIRGLLSTYEHSLNTSDAGLAVGCYLSDGVFMPTTLPTAAGEGLAVAYQQTFAAITLEVTFTIDELVVVGGDFAYALTRSNGIQMLRADGSTTAESNREIFLFGREGGQWKIARYMFNKPQ